MRCPPGLVLTSITGLSAVGQAVAIAENTSSCRRTEVVILGAGVAGVTSAEALHNASISDFLIVERNDYVGGRAHHTTFGRQPDGTPYTVELGANWIQGLNQPQGPANPIWLLAQKHGLRTGFADYGSVLTYDEDGYSDYEDLLDEFDEAYASAVAYSGELLGENRPGVSARTGLALGGWRPEPGDMHRQAVEWWRWDFESAVPPDSSSLLFTASADNFTFGGDVVLNEFVVDEEGLNRIFVKEAGEFLEENDPRLILNTVVQNITYSGDGVRVDMDDGTCVEAEHAICTFSVGVLQHGVVRFDPALPEWKLEAIESFRMTTYTKIFMQFNESFWDDDTQNFLYADPAARGWYPLFQSLNAPGFLEGSNIIVATVVGPYSYLVENQSDEETKSQVLEVLRAMFPDEEIPEPVDFMYPRWSREEWVYGSYNSWPVGTTLQTHQDLRANIGRLWFAGEANSAESYGFLHGAWFEGREVGARVAGVLNGECGLEDTIPDGCGSLARYEAGRGAAPAPEFTEYNGCEVDTSSTSSFFGLLCDQLKHLSVK